MALDALHCRWVAFRSDDRGSAAIDWVALAAGVLLLGVVVVYSLFSVGVSDVTSSIDEAMHEADCSDASTSAVTAGTTGPEQERACPDVGTAPDFN